MIPSIFGALTVLLCGTLLLRASTSTMLAAVLLLSLMGGSAAFFMPALGNSSVQPAILALGFLLLKCILPGQTHTRWIGLAAKDLVYLILFALYGAIGAWLLPRMFAGSISVTPLRPQPDNYIYAVSPLDFSSQNVTVSVYLMVTLFAAICGYVAVMRPTAHRVVVRTAAQIAAIHAFLGLSGVVLAGTAYASFLGFFRNGYYAQLNQSFGGLVRMNGIWPEPAAYAAYGFAWLVFNTELWLRNVESRWTGPASMVLALALLASTSSTAYAGLLAYGVILLLRWILAPGDVRPRKAIVFVAGALLITGGVMALFVARPELIDEASKILSRIIFDKATSESGLQRAFWAKQGYAAFTTSWGIGIGAGSFRSSSLLTAILGSMGIIGILALGAHMLRVLRPWSRSTYGPVDDARTATGVAAAWAAFIMLIPASIAAATPDPGFIWGFFSGMALALRRTLYSTPAQRSAIILNPT